MERMRHIVVHAIAGSLVLAAIIVLATKPRPAAPGPGPVVDTMPGDRCWGLERWTIEGDSVILLKFRKLPSTGSEEAK